MANEKIEIIVKESDNAEIPIERIEIQSSGDDERTDFDDEPDAASSDAVSIAAIEADRDVTIAAINAETASATIAASEREKSELDDVKEELQLCRKEITELTEKLASMTGPTNLLTPLVPLEEVEISAEEMEELPTAEEILSTQASTPTPTSETPMELSDESAVEKVEEKITLVRTYTAI